jgi:DNA-binding NtrC family response regulator
MVGAVDRTVARRRVVSIKGGALRIGRGKGGLALSIGAEPRVVGRSDACDLVLDDPSVSAAPVELVATDLGVRVKDLGSSNGTLLAGHRVDVAYLTTEARLTVGHTELFFRPADADPVPLAKKASFGRLVGSSVAMRRLFENLSVLAKTDLSVLILGETGTGKELVARAIHDASPRAKHPFVVVDCGAIPMSLAESTLFGHERGAFTGALAKQSSPFVDARSGTVFLDELGELPLEVQPKLLRVLAEKQVRSVGGREDTPVDVRIVAATRRDILREVNRETFRSDLYFRVAQARLELPALRDRREDLPLLAERIFADLGADGAFARLDAESLDRADRYDWPGNVRELRNVLALSLAYDDGGTIDLAPHLASESMVRPSGASGVSMPKGTFAQAKRELEESYFKALAAACAGNVSEMSRRSGVDRKTVRDQMRRLRLPT